MELISREELLKQIETDSEGNEGQYGDEWLFIDTINSIPAVEERKRGSWIYEECKRIIDETDEGQVYAFEKKWHCSRCRFSKGFMMYRPNEKYYPNCGAKMYEDDKDIYVPNKGE